MAEFYKITGTNVVKGAGRLMVADTTQAFPTQISDVIDTTDYDAASGWTDVGATTGGIVITRGFDTEGFTVDQVVGDLGEDITGWNNSIETSLAETSLENFDLAWVGGSISTSGNERKLTFGDPANVPQKKLAILFQDRYGFIRLYAFRLVQRAGDDSALTHEKGGDPLALPILFRAFPDTTVTDRDERIFTIFQQTDV